jgi:molecular chaperone Hsp33
MADSTADHDLLTRFLIERAGVRGVLVHLDQAWEQIRERADGAAGRAPPGAVIELLGEATAAAALFTAHAKVEGRLSIQMRGDGVLRTLFAECTAAGTLRAIAQLGGEDDLDEASVSRDLRELGPDALLAITVENPGRGGLEPTRYQGFVALQSDSLSGAFEDYFRQSEQLPTRLLLAADGRRAAGLMLQKLPHDGGDEDGWARAGALFDTLGPAELLGESTAIVLQRLFHEDGVQVLDGKPLRFACSCSRERVEAMLQSLGEEEAMAAAAEAGGQAEIRCEFCGRRYCFPVSELHALFTAPGRVMAAPERLQ